MALPRRRLAETQQDDQKDQPRRAPPTEPRAPSTRRSSQHPSSRTGLAHRGYNHRFALTKPGTRARMRIMTAKSTSRSSSLYVVKRNGAYRITGTRVSLDSIVYAYRDGQSPESILISFPVLTLEQIYGAITFYLGNQKTVDKYLKEGEAKYEALRQASRAKNPELYERLARFRQPLSRS